MALLSCMDPSLFYIGCLPWKKILAHLFLFWSLLLGRPRLTWSSSLPFQRHFFIIRLGFIRVPQSYIYPPSRFRIYFHLTNIYRLPILFRGLCLVLVVREMDFVKTSDLVSRRLISAAMFLCLYLFWSKSYSFFNPNHFLLSPSGLLSTWPNHPKAMYQTTMDSPLSPKPPEILQTSQFLR